MFISSPPLKEHWPVTCKTPGDLVVSRSFREYPAAPKQGRQIAWRQNKCVRKKMDEGGGWPGYLMKQGKEVKAGW